MDNKCKEIKDLSEYLVEYMLLRTEKLISEIRIINEAKIETIIRNQIIPPINGQISKSKLRWRGINTILHDDDGLVIGLIQRGKVVGENGVLGVFENGRYKPYK